MNKTVIIVISVVSVLVIAGIIVVVVLKSGDSGDGGDGGGDGGGDNGKNDGDPLTSATPLSGDTILFLGNSLTSTHDLPSKVNFITGTTSTQSIPGGVRLSYHLENSIGLLDDQTYVILQGQSLESNLWEQTHWQANIGTNLVNAIEAIGATVVWMATWTHGGWGGDHTDSGVETENLRFTENFQRYYEQVQDIFGGRLAPCGWAMRMNWLAGINVISDEIHPTIAGQWGNAFVLYATITGRNPEDLVINDVGIDASTMTTLKTNAWNAYQEHGIPGRG